MFTPFLIVGCCHTIEMQIEHQCWSHIEIVFGLPEGRGVFSTSSIPAGETICNYGGSLLKPDNPIIFDPELSKYLFEFEWRNADYCLHFAPDDPNLSFGALMNHSSVHPNVIPRLFFIGGNPEILFLAKHNIPPGTELLWNYGPFYTNVRPCVTSCKKCGKFYVCMNIVFTNVVCFRIIFFIIMVWRQS